jgi:hypothetical protein
MSAERTHLEVLLGQHQQVDVLSAITVAERAQG